MNKPPKIMLRKLVCCKVTKMDEDFVCCLIVEDDMVTVHKVYGQLTSFILLLVFAPIYSIDAGFGEVGHIRLMTALAKKSIAGYKVITTRFSFIEQIMFVVIRAVVLGILLWIVWLVQQFLK